MFYFFDDIFGTVAFIAAVAFAIWTHQRLGRLEREHKALLGFVLSSPSVGQQAQPASTVAQPTAGVDAEADADATADMRVAAASPQVTLLDETASSTPALADVAARSAAELGPPIDAAPTPPAADRLPHPADSPVARAPRRDVETALGTRWAVWVGGVALALGGLFLVRYSIEAGWFGPAARLSFAALFGVVLLAVGEFLRRTGYRMRTSGAAGAYIPAVLTAAGAFSLFATIYAAHAMYGFIGPATAFFLLGAIGILTTVLALVHGQALGGLGLLGSLVTPVLVASEAPNHWALFVFLAIVMVSTVAVARVRLWTFLATAAFAGMGLWILLYLTTALDDQVNLGIVLFASLAMLATLSALWLSDFIGEEQPPHGPLDAASVASAVFLGITALGLCSDPTLAPKGDFLYGAVLIAAMLAVAFVRRRAIPLVFAAGIVTIITYLKPALAGGWRIEFSGGEFAFDGLGVESPAPHFGSAGGVIALLFLAAGMWKARAHVASQPARATIWAAWGAAVPVIVVACLWLAFGNPDRDYIYAAITIVLTVLLVAAGEWTARAESPSLRGGEAVSATLLGAGVAAVAFLHMSFGSALTTILVGAAAIVPATATRWRNYPVLGWLALGSVLVVLARCAFDPTIVGASELGKTPIFNVLLPGYGIPALAFGFCAWQLARTTNGRPRLAMEAAAILFAMLTVGMLVRHAMNGGVLDRAGPSLAEQAIYTLMSLGAGGILLALDRRSPSPVMRYGSIGFGLLSVLLAVLQHLLLLNPVFTDEATGRIAFFNLLFLGYLLPALAAAGLAFYARGKRPRWYTVMLGLLAAALAFAYATLSVRRWFQGENIALWKGFTQLETYAYSAVWLLLGVVVLVIGIWQRSYALRAASAALIAAAVVKVFLIDMSELEGVLRALSFMGLGAALIGIGLFYQRLLRRAAETDAGPTTPTPPA